VYVPFFCRTFGFVPSRCVSWLYPVPFQSSSALPLCPPNPGPVVTPSRRHPQFAFGAFSQFCGSIMSFPGFETDSGHCVAIFPDWPPFFYLPPHGFFLRHSPSPPQCPTLGISSADVFFGVLFPHGASRHCRSLLPPMRCPATSEHGGGFFFRLDPSGR